MLPRELARHLEVAALAKLAHHVRGFCQYHQWIHAGFDRHGRVRDSPMPIGELHYNFSKKLVPDRAAPTEQLSHPLL